MVTRRKCELAVANVVKCTRSDAIVSEIFYQSSKNRQHYERNLLKKESQIHRKTTSKYTTNRMVNVIGMILMGVSNAVSWHLILKESSSSLSQLRSVVWKIALFYTLWALYNRYLARRKAELGHHSFALFTAACIENPLDSFHTKIPLLLTCGLILINFAGVFPLMAYLGGIQKFAKKAHRKDTSKMVVVWGYTYAVYVASNVALWSYCFYLFLNYPLEASTTTTSEAEF